MPGIGGGGIPINGGGGGPPPGGGGGGGAPMPGMGGGGGPPIPGMGGGGGPPMPGGGGGGGGQPMPGMGGGGGAFNAFETVVRAFGSSLPVGAVPPAWPSLRASFARASSLSARASSSCFLSCSYFGPSTSGGLSESSYVLKFFDIKVINV